MTKQRLLPVFGNRNPFQGGAVEEETKGIVTKEFKRSAADQAALNLGEKTTEQSPMLPSTELPLIDAIAREDTPRPEPKPYRAPASRGWRRLLRWPLGRQRRRLRGKDAVQAELSLEAVQPVRNTLVDTDLEIVLRPAKPPSNPFIGTVSRGRNAGEASTHKKASRSGAWWNRIAGRWFGSK